MRYLAIWLVLCGVVCGQVEFDGVDQYVFNDSEAIKTATNITLSAWVRIDGSGTQAIMSRDDSASNRSWLLYCPMASKRLQVIFWDDGGSIYGTYTNDVMETGVLTHVCAVADGTNVYLYKDGELVQTGTKGDGVYGSSLGTYIGVRHPNNYLPFDGLVHDSRIYTRALSAEEISEIYHRPWSLADDPDLVLRTCITTNDTGDALTGVARNNGTGVDGTYVNSPTAAPWTIQMNKPRRATINID